MNRLLIGVAAMALVTSASVQSPAVTKMLGLFQSLSQGSNSKQVSFSFSEAELNEYLSYSLQAIPRPGIKSVAVKVFPGNYVSTFTTVDFDAIQRWKPGTVPALLRPVLNGQKTIWLDIRFQAKDGAATFTVEKAYFQSMRLPAFFVEKMMQVLAARQPEKYDTTKPVPLPFGLRQVYTAAHLVSGQN